jgi:glycopeptide antibiotics resistance protein
MNGTRRRLARTAIPGAIYLVVLAVILFFPVHVDGGHGQAFEPLMHLFALVGVPLWLSYEVIEFGANMLLFVPLGGLVAYVVGPMALWLAPLLGAAVSTLVELIQGTFLPGRTADPTDVVSNTAGTLLGAVVVVIVLVARRRSGTRIETTTNKEEP